MPQFFDRKTRKLIDLPQKQIYKLGIDGEEHNLTSEEEAHKLADDHFKSTGAPTDYLVWKSEQGSQSFPKSYTTGKKGK